MGQELRAAHLPDYPDGDFAARHPMHDQRRRHRLHDGRTLQV